MTGLQRPSNARQSLAARQKELSEEHRMILKRLKCIENKQNLCNFPFFTHFFLFFFQFFLLFSLFFCFFLLFFSIFLSPSAQQRWTAQQNGPSIEGPEGPRPTPMLTAYAAHSIVTFSRSHGRTHPFYRITISVMD